MGIFNFNKEKVVEVVEQVKNGIKAFNFNGYYNTNVESIERANKYRSKNTIDGLPVIDLFNTPKGWIRFDSGDNFPLYILDLYNTSPMNQSIINRKADMYAGKDIIITDTSTNEYDKICNLIFTKEIRNLVKKAAFNYSLYGAFGIELFYNGEQLTKMEIIEPQYLRAKKPNTPDGDIEGWYYSRNFLDPRFKVYEYCEYEPNTKKEEDSYIYYYKDHNTQIDVYGLPTWLSAQKSILVDGKISDYNNSSLDNSFSPGIHINFITSPNQTEEEIVDMAKKFNDSYVGTKKTSKPFITTSSSVDTMPSIKTIDNSTKDKSFETLQASITSQILIGHNITDPSLFGIQVAGKLGNSDISTSYRIFENTTIKPVRDSIQDVFNKIFTENGIKLSIELTEYDIIK